MGEREGGGGHKGCTRDPPAAVTAVTPTSWDSKHTDKGPAFFPLRPARQPALRPACTAYQGGWAQQPELSMEGWWELRHYSAIISQEGSWQGDTLGKNKHFSVCQPLLYCFTYLFSPQSFPPSESPTIFTCREGSPVAQGPEQGPGEGMTLWAAKSQEGQKQLWRGAYRLDGGGEVRGFKSWRQ